MRIPAEPDINFYKTLSFEEKSVILLSGFNEADRVIFFQKLPKQQRNDLTKLLNDLKPFAPFWAIKWALEDYLESPSDFPLFEQSIQIKRFKVAS